MMKTIGLIGGMSWESTVSYYQLINQGVKQQLGGLHSAKIVLVSVDFAEIEALQHQGD
jgi:aspartate racemase